MAELQELEHWKARFEAADGASQGYFSRRWVAKNILNVNEEEFERMQAEMFYDRKHDFFLEQVGEAAAAEGSGLSGALGVGGPEEDMASEEPLGAAPEEAAPEEAGPLLATSAPEPLPLPTDSAEAPANRDEPKEFKDQFGERITTTAASNGKPYRPVKVDGRNGFKQAQLGQAGHQYTGRAARTRIPGKAGLDAAIRPDYRLSEDQEPNYYDEQEKEIFQENFELKKLIDSLKKLEKTKDETET